MHAPRVISSQKAIRLILCVFPLLKSELAFWLTHLIYPTCLDTDSKKRWSVTSQGTEGWLAYSSLSLPFRFYYSRCSVVRNFPWPLWFFTNDSQQPCNHITDIFPHLWVYPIFKMSLTYCSATATFFSIVSWHTKGAGSRLYPWNLS